MQLPALDPPHAMRVPLRHGWHAMHAAMCAVGLYFARGHEKQSALPVVFWNLPASHGMHAAEPLVLEVATGQERHARCAACGEYLPAGQLRQNDCFSVGWNRPAVHAAQDIWLARAWNLPAEHGTQRLSFLRVKPPGLHSRQYPEVALPQPCRKSFGHAMHCKQLAIPAAL